jgi:Leucine-rich repeat (LRR) protein
MYERADRRSLPCRVIATLVLFLLLAIPAGAVTPAERNALISLYDATGGPQWKTNTGWRGAPGTECGWTKVNCDANGSVVNLFLGSNNLVGTIPAAIGDLPRLQRLYMDNNALSGPIPAQIGALASLTDLGLATNQLSGTIPPQLGALSNLKFLFLGSNALEGPVPPGLGNLTNLEALTLSHNKLVGTIPTAIGDLSRLQRLYLNNNALSGPMPPQLALASLTELGLATNQLTGTIPPQLGALSNLKFLFLGINALEGSIPPALGNLTRLEILDIAANKLTGEIPDLSRLTALTTLNLRANKLTGAIPPLGTLSNLKALVLDTNELSGPIPSLAGLRNLERLQLYKNRLSGPIPAEVGSLTALQELSLFENELSGSIPPIGGLAELRIIFLASNKLSGLIPSLAGLQKLEKLHLHRNKLSGPIPAEIGSLPALQELLLGENELSGSIPAQLGALASLRSLMLPSNKLSGKIPDTIGDLSNLQDLGLSNNLLDGEIPATLGKLKKLQTLNLSVNALSGAIPNLGGLTNLRVLQAGSNQLSGEIPATLTNLAGLEDLRFNKNQLSGPIPADIGRLGNLGFLDLFQNQLSGPVPPSILDLSKLKYLYLSKNQLTGAFLSDIGKLSSLVQLQATENQLDGPIASDIGKLSSLTLLLLSVNKISGPIPESIGDLAELTNLQLAANQLSGAIPDSLGKLGKLQKLHISNNQLTGTLPATLANLTNLLEFSVYSNQLSGTIPPGLERLTNLTKLILGANRFTGGIPAGLGKLTNLRELNFYSNQLSGTIPAAIGDLGNLEILSFNTNSLEGRIPTQLGKLTKLRLLRLASNRLEGTIPRELANLANLETLTVDANQLSGSIPPDLVNLQKLTTINLRFNGLTSSDAALNSFLARLQPDWDLYQNVPPSDVQVVADVTTVALSWKPISTKTGGGYQIAVANTPSGPFTVQQTTSGKSISTAVVTGLSPSTDYFFAVRSITYPSGFGTSGERPYQQNQLVSDYTPAPPARTKPAGATAPNVIVFAFPSGPLIRGLGVDRDNSYVLANIGQAQTTITLTQSEFFFTQSPASFTLPPGGKRSIALKGTDQAPNVYEGASIPSGAGVPAGLTIPVRLLVLSLTPANVVAVPSATRIDLATDTNGSVDFTNDGTDTLIGVFVSDVDWIEPQTRSLIEIRPGQKVTLRFSVQRAKRPAEDGSLTGGLYLVYPRTFDGLLAMLANPLDAGNPGVSVSTISVVDTKRPNVSQAAAPPLAAGEVALFIPAIGTVRGPNALYVSDVNVVNAQGASAIGNVRAYYTPETSQIAPSRADLPPLAPNSLVAYGNIVGSVFQSESSGTLQIRAAAGIENLAVSARIFNIQGKSGTFGTAIPVFRSDRAAAAGQDIVLTGVRKDANTRTNLFIQEMSGNPARFDIRFLDRDGAQLGTHSGEVNPFSLRRVLNQVPEGAVTAVITNALESAGRIGAYATPVDARSNDFWSVVDWSRHAGFERFEPMVIPVAGSLRGVNNTFFRSDLTVSNRSAVAQKGTLRFISRSSQVFESLIELAAGRSLALDDLLGQYFHLGSDAGYLVFAPQCEAADESLGTEECDAAFSLASRNFATVGDEPGTFGTAVPAVALASALRVGQSRLIGGIEDVSNSRGPGTYRTNVGLLETAGAEATVRITVTKPETKGSLSFVSGASLDVPLAPREYKQINGIAASVLGSGTEVRNATLLFQILDGKGAVVVFASSIDNGTQDAVLRVE